MNLRKSDKIQLELLALKFRQEQGVKFDEPVSVHQMLRNKNIITSFQPLSEGFEGMAIKIPNKEQEARLFMLVNTSSNYSRQRFTACHELYHLLYQKDFTVSYDVDGEDGRKSLDEQAADYFARCLLLPRDGVLSLVPEEERKKDVITLATILKVEQNFRCSRSCLLYRLKEMDLISDAVYQVFLHDVIRGAAEYGYPTSLYRPTYSKELIGDYNVKARQLYDKGMISQAKYFGLLYDMGIDFGKEALDGKGESHIIGDAIKENNARFPVDRMEDYKTEKDLGKF